MARNGPASSSAPPTQLEPNEHHLAQSLFSQVRGQETEKKQKNKSKKIERKKEIEKEKIERKD